MVDKYKQLGNSAWLSCVLRFVTDSGPKERFVGFANVTRKKLPSDFVLCMLEEFGCSGKVMDSELIKVQLRVEESVPQALSVHCYANGMNLVLSHSTSDSSAIPLLATLALFTDSG
ncbi:hypothetical protein AAFF_G00187380 [Aldrovandia affinis]|uniref:Uncharacterized protein n=1 Tax=Aldrovandia affinis TaxID=143900 RepID=A0AAD7SZX2_9TELE|nr:hypothetical protein AAFF_G00187380 [Aldrovandia affinis]